MGSEPSNSPVVQQLQLLLTGYGYNFYNSVNKARSDDLLVRERASYYLAQAVNMLANLRGAYQRRFIPQLTPDVWNNQGSRSLRQFIQRVNQIAHERERFLLLPM